VYPVLYMLLLLGFALAEPLGSYNFPYTSAEMDSLTRSAIAACVTLVMFGFGVLARPRGRRPAWDVALGQAGLTTFIGFLIVLCVRVATNNIAAEMIAAGAVGLQGPSAGRWVIERFKVFFGSKGGGVE
jgi:hypothetical protein